MPKTSSTPSAVGDAEHFTDIPMAPVSSNQVRAVGYDASTKTLAVTFTRGSSAVYHYPGVEPEVHAAFIAAESVGKFFGQHIKPLPFQKFTPPVAASAPESEAIMAAN